MERQEYMAVSAGELTDLAAEIVASGGQMEVRTRGYSMQPMLTFDRSRVRLAPPGDLHRGDVALYRYPDGKCVIHRIVRVRRDGTLDCRGDYNLRTERGVRPDWVLAVVTDFSRSGTWRSRNDGWYRLYWNIWLLLWPARRIAAPLWRRAKGVLQRIGKKGSGELS